MTLQHCDGQHTANITVAWHEMWYRSSLQSSPSTHDEISHLVRRYIHQRLFCALTVCRQLWLNQRVRIVIYYMCTVCIPYSSTLLRQMSITVQHPLVQQPQISCCARWCQSCGNRHSVNLEHQHARGVWSICTFSIRNIWMTDVLMAANGFTRSSLSPTCCSLTSDRWWPIQFQFIYSYLHLINDKFADSIDDVRDALVFATVSSL